VTFDGKRVFVTGGASGIGAATAELFAAKGATVVVADVSEDAGQALVRRLGDRHRFVRLDVSDQGAWERAAPEITEGGLDVVLLNAGVMTRPAGVPIFNDPLPWITPASMDRLIGVNMCGVLWGTLACLPALEERKGTLLVISSGAGIQPFALDPTYTMTKFALVGLTCSLAPTLDERGVRAVTVCPHAVDTAIRPPDLHEKKLADGYSSPPAHMAESILHIYDRAKSGEVWYSRAGDVPYLVDMEKHYYT
jgi:NAD(P)-dependent dehydrogenase (short-subunit alcohol dehydrogenase family)